ncbi:MAG: alpha/beta fold hydrolase [Halobacteriovoraceae bacterium]|jgi:cis-3-alkyl-4-acyloxetan-2-one decarboxylase|nr:alpha/beta fold hydrolase [Halobacteriovoraceae bacterium]MBT5095876.1 alpha/beta fold hydrolase [Halobacteriovoraceae bacterium]
MVIPQNLKEEYPFSENSLMLNSGHKLNYVDEGSGEPILMLHGNPTWSFYYRNLIKEMAKTHRVIVPDHIGCGLSDKPQDYDYSLENHIQNIEALVSKLELKKLSLVVHDWGGAIGFGYATRHNQNISKIVALNTAAYRSKHMPKSIAICKIPFFGERLVRHLNAFAWPATFMSVEKPLSKIIKAGYLLPYNNYKNRIATARFVKDIPLTKGHPSYGTLKAIEEGLPDLKVPKLFLWGGKDFCFNDHFYRDWKGFYPEAEYTYIKDAGHYVLEDAKDTVIEKTREFLS